MNSPTITLAPYELESFAHNGFLAIPAITSHEEIDELRVIYDRLFRERIGWEDGNQFDLATDEAGGMATLPQLINPSRYVPQLADTRYVRNAAAIARQILGEDLEQGYRDQMIFKPAVRGSATPWHQDQAYHAPEYRYRTINFWMPLDDTSVASGCMHFVPGSHRLDVLPHRSIGGNPSVHGLELDNPDPYAPYAVACPVPAGGCTLHAAYTLHYTGPNVSQSPRRAYTLVFSATPVRRSQPIDNYWMRAKQTSRMQREQQRRKQS